MQSQHENLSCDIPQNVFMPYHDDEDMDFCCQKWVIPRENKCFAQSACSLVFFKANLKTKKRCEIQGLLPALYSNLTDGTRIEQIFLCGGLISDLPQSTMNTILFSCNYCTSSTFLTIMTMTRFPF